MGQTMHREESDYRRLLTEVLPVDSLDEPLRKLVEESIGKGDDVTLWRTTLLVMDALCSRGLFLKGVGGGTAGASTFYRRGKLLTVTVKPPPGSAAEYEFTAEPALFPGIAPSGGDAPLDSLFCGIATRAAGDELADSLGEITGYLRTVLSPLAVHLFLFEGDDTTPVGTAAATRFVDTLRPSFEKGGDAVYIPDLAREPDVFRRIGAKDASSAVLLPLRTGDVLYGAMEVLHREVGPFGQKELGLLSLLALLAAGRIRNAGRLEKLIYIDVLTGVFTRRFFEEQVVRELERANRESVPLAFVMVDLDDFKGINDRHGHATGDRVLGAVGRLLNENVRKIDLVTRFGGEEFAILLPGASRDQAAMICERLRSLVEKLILLDDKGGKLGLTASIGIALYPEHTGATDDLAAVRDDLLRKADGALYGAKGEGKNRVLFWDAAGEGGNRS